MQQVIQVQGPMRGTNGWGIKEENGLDRRTEQVDEALRPSLWHHPQDALPRVAVSFRDFSFSRPGRGGNQTMHQHFRLESVRGRVSLGSSAHLVAGRPCCDQSANPVEFCWPVLLHIHRFCVLQFLRPPVTKLPHKRCRRPLFSSVRAAVPCALG